MSVPTLRPAHLAALLAAGALLPTAAHAAEPASVATTPLPAGLATPPGPAASSSPTPALATPASPSPAPTSPTPAVASPAPTPSPALAPRPLSWAVNGAAEVRTGIRGSVAIVGRFDGTFDPRDGSITGGFTLTPTQAHVTALGFLPAVADTEWTFTEPVRGSFKDGVLRLRVSVKIRHPKLTMFGLQVAGGPNCQTAEPSIIELQAPVAPGGTGPEAGGTLVTSGAGFRISALSGCGPLNGFLSLVAAGSGNQASLTFTPPAR